MGPHGNFVWPDLQIFQDYVNWPSHSNDGFCIWKHLLNHIWVTETLNRPQKRPNNGGICEAVYPLFYSNVLLYLYILSVLSVPTLSIPSKSRGSRPGYRRQFFVNGKIVFFYLQLNYIISYDDCNGLPDTVRCIIGKTYNWVKKVSLWV